MDSLLRAWISIVVFVLGGTLFVVFGFVLICLLFGMLGLLVFLLACCLA